MDQAGYERVERLLDIERYADAEAAARSLVSAHPQDAEALQLLGRALRGRGRNLDAIDAFHAAVGLDPRDPSGFILLSEACRDGARPVQAMAAAEEAVRLAPNLWVAYYVRARARSGRTKQDRLLALRDADEAVRLAPMNADAHVLRGLCLDALRRRKEERAAYEAALRIDPHHAFALNNLAALDAARGRLGSASRHVTAGLAQAPQNDHLQQNLRHVLVRLLQRLWWLLVIVALVEFGLLASGQPWWTRAAAGTALLALLGALVHRAGRRLPRGTPYALRTLWEVSNGWLRLVFALWAITFVCTVIVAFAPEAAAVVAMAIVVGVARLLFVGSILAWIGSLITRGR